MFWECSLTTMLWDILYLILVKFPACVCLGVPGTKNYLQYCSMTPVLFYGCVPDAQKGAS